MQKKFIATWMLAVLFSSPAFASKQELIIYTYDSFSSDWGPGSQVKKDFEKDCNCTIKYDKSEDAAAILTRLKIEKDKNKADVVLGIDSNLVAEARNTGLFEKYTSSAAKDFELPSPAILDKEGYFTPTDYSWFAFMYDSVKIKNPPKSMQELLDSKTLNKAILVQDPRTSTPGLGLMLWIKALYADKAPEVYAKLRKKTLNVTKGWSDSYGLFTKGEAPMVFSYVTSELYHIIVEKDSRLKAAIFSEGHYLQIEGAAITTTSKKKELAKKFIDFIADKRFQKAMAEKNWMLPVIPLTQIPDLPKPFLNIIKPSKTLYFNSEKIAEKRKGWTEEWLNNFR